MRHRVRLLPVTAVAVVAFAMPACTPVARGGPVGWGVLDPMLARVNAERAAVGAAPLTRCAALDRAAQAHTADQAAHNQMSHIGSDGSTLADRAARAGYRGWTALGENVAYGYPNVASVMAAWMNSPGHRANILSRNYTHFGAGYAVGSNGAAYWTQDFGRGGTC
jgi:uncharacterized protein YkwD